MRHVLAFLVVLLAATSTAAAARVVRFDTPSYPISLDPGLDIAVLQSEILWSEGVIGPDGHSYPGLHPVIYATYKNISNHTLNCVAAITTYHNAVDIVKVDNRWLVGPMPEGQTWTSYSNLFYPSTDTRSITFRLVSEPESGCQ